MRGLDMVANAAVLTLLTAVCSIPLVTIGAALSASYEAAWAAKEGRGYLLRTYFSAFKRNFPVATAIWSVLAATGLMLIALWLFTTSIAIGLTVASLQWLPKGLYLLLILGFGIVVQLQIPLFEHALKPYVNKVAA